MMKQPLALTPGEPAGIGPDLAVLTAQQAFDRDIVAIADPNLLLERAAIQGVTLSLREWSAARPFADSPAGTLSIVPQPLERPATPGKLDAANAASTVAALDRAIKGCLPETSEFAGLITGPMQKSIINEAGIPFSGHTERLAELSNTDTVVMMLATPGLRVALVTTHLPLSEVSQAITPARLTRIIDITHRELVQRFGLEKPRLLVCGLNPHAGENGHLGREEIDIIIPTLEALRESHGMNLQGPLPADTLFTPHYLKNADAVIAMYHDQGLPVLKHMGFGNAVNITLGLPFVRTSVDHGTALDLAGSPHIDSGSMMAAITLADELTQSAVYQ